MKLKKSGHFKFEIGLAQKFRIFVPVWGFARYSTKGEGAKKSPKVLDERPSKKHIFFEKGFFRKGGRENFGRKTSRISTLAQQKLASEKDTTFWDSQIISVAFIKLFQ
jgi:hypothetical protein